MPPLSIEILNNDPFIYPLRIRKGYNLECEVVVYDDDGVEFDFTDWDVVLQAKIRKEFVDDAPVIDLGIGTGITVTGGTLAIIIESAVTAEATWKTAEYELAITKDGDRYAVSAGPVTLVPGVVT